MKTKRMSPKLMAQKQARLMDQWNEANPVGTPVIYWEVAYDIGKPGLGKEATTRSEAWLLGGHTAVVLITGVSGCVCIEHLQCKNS